MRRVGGWVPTPVARTLHGVQQTPLNTEHTEKRDVFVFVIILREVNKENQTHTSHKMNTNKHTCRKVSGKEM